MSTTEVIGQKLASLSAQLESVNELISEFAAEQDVEGQLEYVNLLEQQADLEKRISELKSHVETEKAASGVMIKLREGLKEYAAWLVEKPTSFVQDQFISINSPLGQAVLGKQPGEQVAVHTPSGVKQVEILAVAA